MSDSKQVSGVRTRSIHTYLRLLAVVLITALMAMGCVKRAHDLVDEVFSLPKPEAFIPVRVDDIVKKYISPGMDRAQAVTTLSRQGFSTMDRTWKGEFQQCPACDSEIVDARYDHRPWHSFGYDYAVTVRLGFKEGRVAIVEGWYVKSMP